MQFGLSSLGRAESRVLPTFDAVLGVLRSAANGEPFKQVTSSEFFAGEARIAAHAEELFDLCRRTSPVRLMVTLPSEAAEDAAFMIRLAELGVEVVRINCAHDDDSAWARMIAQATERRDGRAGE